jgi:hypothetical protein
MIASHAFMNEAPDESLRVIVPFLQEHAKA